MATPAAGWALRSAPFGRHKHPSVLLPPPNCSTLSAGLIQGAQGQVAKEVRAGCGAQSSILLPAAASRGDLSVSPGAQRVSPGGRGGAV